MILFACSSSVTIETPQGEMKVKKLEYKPAGHHHHHLVLTLTRADGKMFSDDDLTYINQSDAYLKDNQGRIYKIPSSFKGRISGSYNIYEFRLNFRGDKPREDRSFTLHWPENSPLKIKREKHHWIDS